MQNPRTNLKPAGSITVVTAVIAGLFGSCPIRQLHARRGTGPVCRRPTAVVVGTTATARADVRHRLSALQVAGIAAL